MLDLSLKVSIKDNDKDLIGKRLESSFNLTEEEELKELVAYMKLTLVRVAKDALLEEQSRGFEKNPVLTVDNKKGKKEEDVKPFGTIVYDSKVATDDLLLPIYRGLIDRSRVDTGLYSDSHFVFFRGDLIATNESELKKWVESGPDIRDGARIRFVNVMPYASKLERNGVTATGSKMSLGIKKKKKSGNLVSIVRRPNGAYYLTAKSIMRKYKNNSSIKFEWINGRSFNLTGVPSVNRSGKKLRTTFHPKSGRKGYYVYPSISIIITKEGIK